MADQEERFVNKNVEIDETIINVHFQRFYMQFLEVIPSIYLKNLLHIMRILNIQGLN